MSPQSSTMPFGAFHRHGFARVGAATPRVALADPLENARSTLQLARRAADDGADLVVFPELGLSGYSIDDLHMQDGLLNAVEDAVAAVVEGTRDLSSVLLVGAPLRRKGRLYNLSLIHI